MFLGPTPNPKSPHLPGAGFSGLLPSAARNENTARPGVRAPVLPSSRPPVSVRVHLPRQPPAGEQRAPGGAAGEGRSRPTTTVDAFQTCRLLLEVPPPPPSPLPARRPRRVPVRLNRLQAGGACAAKRERPTPSGTLFRGVDVQSDLESAGRGGVAVRRKGRALRGWGAAAFPRTFESVWGPR